MQIVWKHINLGGDSISWFLQTFQGFFYIHKLQESFFLTYECRLWFFSLLNKLLSTRMKHQREQFILEMKQSTNLFIMHTPLHESVKKWQSSKIELRFTKNLLTKSLIFSVSCNYFQRFWNIPQPLQWKIKNSHKWKIIILLYLMLDEPFIERNLLISSVGSRGYLHWFRPSNCWWRAGP